MAAPRLSALVTAVLCGACALGRADDVSANDDGPRAPAVGELLPRIECAEGYEARVFASGLEAPDGLAFDGQGRLCVAEERAGRVTRLLGSGRQQTLASDLSSPEGLCVGPGGTLFVVEDVAGGRLLRLGDAEPAVLASGLDAPEGVVAQGDRLYVTESTIQLVEQLSECRTRVLELRREGTGWSAPTVVVAKGLPLSFAELLADGPERLILVSETGGELMPAGLLRLDLAGGELTPFAEGLFSPEGLCWSPGAPPGFPLWVAEEDVDGRGHGRLSRVDALGRRSTFASGFGTLEDVVVAADGRVFVSEDSSGLVLELAPALRRADH